MQFLTEALIRQQVAEGLRAKRQAARQPFDPAELETPILQRWIQMRVALARKNRLLLTDQQFADMRSGRPFSSGDRARYVGPTRMERSPTTGRYVTRVQGQRGTITSVLRGREGQPLYTFMPDVPKETQALAATTDIEVMALTTADGLLFERVP